MAPLQRCCQTAVAIGLVVSMNTQECTQVFGITLNLFSCGYIQTGSANTQYSGKVFLPAGLYLG
jgi:hypothetical protein